MKRVKNATGTSQTWVGQMISAGAYYTLEAFEEPRWANNSVFITAVSASQAVMATAIEDITNISDAIDFLKNITKTYPTDYSQTKYLSVPANSVDSDGTVVIPNGETAGVMEFIGAAFQSDAYVMVVFDYGGASQKIIALTRSSGTTILDPTLAANQVIGDGVKKLGIVIVNDGLLSVPVIGGSFRATKL